MTVSELFDALLQLKVKSARELNNIRIDLCINQNTYIPITAVHLSHERVKLVSSNHYRSLNLLQVLSELHRILLRKSNHKREVFMIWKGGSEYIPSNVYLNKKGIVIFMK